MGKTYKQPGHVIDITADGADIAVDEVVVVGDRIAIALVDIPDGETGSGSVEGVHGLPKADAEEIEQGVDVFWTGSAITTTATDNTPAGYAFAAAEADDDEIDVKVNG